MTKLFVALDTDDMDEAAHWAAWTAPAADGYKIGMEYFYRNGVEGYRRIARFEKPIMLDLKLHDIPNTVAGAVRSLLPLRPKFITVHASGGPAMIRQARNAAGNFSDRPHILAVTVLTSMVGNEAQVLGLARTAMAQGADGLVCSVLAAASIRKFLGPDPILVCPGVRLKGEGLDDHAVIATPSMAKEAGADWIVVGRPITQASNQLMAANSIRSELDGRIECP